jgi:hypothetical protein
MPEFVIPEFLSLQHDHERGIGTTPGSRFDWRIRGGVAEKLRSYEGLRETTLRGECGRMVGTFRLPIELPSYCSFKTRGNFGGGGTTIKAF